MCLWRLLFGDRAARMADAALEHLRLQVAEELAQRLAEASANQGA